MLKYYTALVEKDGYRYAIKSKLNDDPVFFDTDIKKTMNREYEEFIQELNDGRIVKYTETTDRGEYLASNLENRVEELKGLVKHHNKLLKYYKGSLLQDETYDLCVSVQETLMKQIGSNVLRLKCYDRNHDEEHEIDELALQCYDVYRKEIEARDFKNVTLYNLNSVQHG